MIDVSIVTHLLMCDEAHFRVSGFANKIGNVRGRKHLWRVCVNIFYCGKCWAHMSLTECNSGISKKKLCLRNKEKEMYLQLRLHCNVLELLWKDWLQLYFVVCCWCFFCSFRSFELKRGINSKWEIVRRVRKIAKSNY